MIKEQILEDIALIKKDYLSLDKKLNQDNYAFHYWILSRLFSIDEEAASDIITEGNDKGIDCFVHFEDSKELFLIQNKFYEDNSVLTRAEISDSLKSSLSILGENKYKRSKDLQDIYNKAKADHEYKIYFHFFVTNDKKIEDAKTVIQHTNNNKPNDINGFFEAKINYLNDISTLYYGESFKENISFKYQFKVKVASQILRIKPNAKEYEMPSLNEAYYITTPLVQIFSMYEDAKKKQYALFEENIREYLGNKSPINTAIIETLKSASDRNDFFYYNNGITIVCDNVKDESNKLEITNPQIVNGCQTVNSIYDVFVNYSDEERKDFDQVFVMTKILVKDKNTEKEKPEFYKNIVKYTNKQNSINENAFGANKNYFKNLKEDLLKRGYVLLVKPSDKNMFKSNIQDINESDLLKKANHFAEITNLKFKSVNSLFIDLDKLIQVYLAFNIDGHSAYTKKKDVLKQSSEIYKDYSLKLRDYLTTDNLLRMYLVYLKAENDRKKSEDYKTPIPYYFIGFLGELLLKNSNKNSVNQKLTKAFENKNIFESLYLYLHEVTDYYKREYKEKNNIEYNQMIKKPIDKQLVQKAFDTYKRSMVGDSLKVFLES